ncbi:MAG: translocation/assembly module TamB domain-containing protein, partial [Luteimonas sp.]
ALRSLSGIAALTVLILLLAYWLLTTIGGRDVLLRQIVARLPDGTTLTWRNAEGPAAGPLTLHDVRFVQRTCPDQDDQPVAFGACEHPGTLVFTARLAVLDPAIRPLLGRRLRLDALRIERATLDLADSAEPFELPRWPDVLPKVEPPLSLQADAIRIDGLKVTQAGQPLIDIRSLRGGLDASAGELHVERVAIDSDRGRFALHGDYAPKDDYATDFTAGAVFPARTGRTPASIGLVARGNLQAMDVALAGNAPAPLRATLTLRAPSPDSETPRWTLRANSDAFDPTLLTGADAGEPIALDLRATGVGGRARLRGRVAQGDLAATIRPSNVQLEDQVLRVQPLIVDAFEGRTTLRGTADFRDRNRQRLSFAANARGLRFGGTDAAGDAVPAIVASSDIGIAGTVQAWAAIGTARLTRDGQTAAVRFDGRGDADRFAIKTLRAQMPTGTLDATGNLGWTPHLNWDLDTTLAGFDPGYFAPGWDGAINGRIASKGSQRRDGAFDATIDVPQLRGRLRGRALDGRGKFALQGSNGEGELALMLGGSRVDAKGRVGDTLDIDARFAPLQLNDLLPDGAGTLRGTLQLTGTRSAPNVDVDMNGNGLRWHGYAAESLTARGKLPWRNGSGALSLTAQGLDAGIAFDSLHVNANGAVENLRIEGDARSEFGTLDFAGSAAKRGANWQGTLDALQLAPLKGPPWRLQTHALYAQTGGNWSLSQSCFASSGGGSLCASADWPRRGLTLHGEQLPLTLLTPYLPELEDSRRAWLLNGSIALDAQVRPAGNAWIGNAQVRSAAGGLRLSARARRDLITYDTLLLDATFTPQRIEARLGAGLNGHGRIDARIATGWDAYAPLSGDIALDTDELTWMELLSPDIVDPQGQLNGRITLGGTRAQPALGGQAQLSRFRTELPALAITLTDGNVRMDAQADGSARITGSLRSGEGTLTLDGMLGWRGESTPLVLNVRGKNVLASDTRDVRALIDPDVVVRYSASEPLSVTGTVGVPSARMDLERLDEGVSASPDVVVVDPVDPERKLATPIVLDLTLALGDDVRLHGFGLDGELGGSLRVRTRPGREMSATGALDVTGRYTAYGQKLTITRGRLNWSNNAIADPVLDIRAEREIGDVTAGIDVDGRASAPRATVWTDPATDESEALAYLALGRPLSSASASESRQLNAASAALSAGGNLLASQLGARIGLDDAGVMESRALGGSVFGIGKFLSPRLYVGYGVSLLGTGQVLTLKYLLRKGFDIQIESSSIENRASINWRKEK